MPRCPTCKQKVPDRQGYRDQIERFRNQGLDGLAAFLEETLRLGEDARETLRHYHGAVICEVPPGTVALP